MVADLETALAAVPDMEAKIEQLTEELALLHTDYDELRQSSVQRADVQGVYHNLAETEVSHGHCFQVFLVLLWNDRPCHGMQYRVPVRSCQKERVAHLLLCSYQPRARPCQKAQRSAAALPIMVQSSF